MQSIIQILKVNDLKKGTSAKTGKPYEMQDAECLLLTADGAVDQVGVLQIPKSLRDKVVPGTFTASFALNANYQDRRIEAVLVDIVPVPPAAQKAATLAPATAKS
jgi:hypothetical protein